MNGVVPGQSIKPIGRNQSPTKSFGEASNYKELKEKITSLEEENDGLLKQLGEALDANVEQAEKVIRLEIMQDQYQSKLAQLKEIG